jgi:adenylate kinase family enzyme
MRIVILGNSGSGKTWLAAELAARQGVPLIHLDEIFWEVGGFDQTRDDVEVDRLVGNHLQAERWIVEGVFGNLAAKFLPSADALLWLDLPWEVCRARLQARGSESKRHMSRIQSEAGLQRLLAWAQDYYSRQGSSSEFGHEKLYSSFIGHRARLSSEGAVVAYLNGD